MSNPNAREDKVLSDQLRRLADEVDAGRFVWSYRYGGRATGHITIELEPDLDDCSRVLPRWKP